MRQSYIQCVRAVIVIAFCGSLTCAKTNEDQDHDIGLVAIYSLAGAFGVLLLGIWLRFCVCSN